MKFDKEVTIIDARKYANSKDFKMPVVYTDAVSALKKCISINDARDFSNAAEALATWAKIYRNDEAGRNAKQLKLHAYRRMGQLAKQLAPGKRIKGGGSDPGPIAKLQEMGLSRHNADAATHLAGLPKAGFRRLIKQDSPPAPTSAAKRFRDVHVTTTWDLIRRSQRNPFCCSGYILRNSAKSIARKLNAGEAKVARAKALALMDWLDEFEQALPKVKKK